MPRSHLLVSGHLLVITHLYPSPHQSHYLREWLSFSLHWIVELLTLSVTLTSLLVDLLCNLVGTLTLIFCMQIPVEKFLHESGEQTEPESFCGET